MRLGKGTWEDKILRENLELLFNETEQEEYMLAELNLRPVGFKTLHLSWSDYEPEYKLEKMSLVMIQVFHLMQTFP